MSGAYKIVKEAPQDISIELNMAEALIQFLLVQELSTEHPLISALLRLKNAPTGELEKALEACMASGRILSSPSLEAMARASFAAAKKTPPHFHPCCLPESGDIDPLLPILQAAKRSGTPLLMLAMSRPEILALHIEYGTVWELQRPDQLLACGPTLLTTLLSSGRSGPLIVCLEKKAASELADYPIAFFAPTLNSAAALRSSPLATCS